MISIWKFKLQPVEQQEVKIPAGAELLTVLIQNGELYLWARVDTLKKLEPRQITRCGTGGEIPIITGKYIGTYQMADGAVVFHVFETNPLRGAMCKIRGSEVSFELDVPEPDILRVAQEIWCNPAKYSDFSNGSAAAYCGFLKFLWVAYPDGSEKRLASIVS